MPLLKTKAVILRSHRWGDADRIVTFFSLQFWKIRGVARGARRQKSRYSGVLEPFGVVELTLFQKTQDSLGSISQIDLISSFSAIREDLAVMTAAARMVKIVESITADRDPNHQMYWALVQSLEMLDPHSDLPLTALLFQIHVLGHTGFNPQIGQCTECGKRILEDPLWFSPRLGGIVCIGCGRNGIGQMIPLSKGSAAFMEQARRLPLACLPRLRAAGKVRMEVTTAIESYFESVVGKPLPDFHSWISS